MCDVTLGHRSPCGTGLGDWGDGCGIWGGRLTKYVATNRKLKLEKSEINALIEVSS